LASLIHGLDGPAQVLIVGASRGIGRALAQALLASDGVARVFVAARSAPVFDAPKAHPLALDIGDEPSLARAAAAVRARTEHLHLVINTAGLLHDGEALQPEKSVVRVTAEALAAGFRVNAFGPILLAKHLLPLLRHAAPCVFASLSARVGSIGDNRLGGWYAYRAAKAAQNQLLRTFAVELARLNPRATVLALHPGTVDTGLSRPFQANVAADKLFTPEYAAARLLEVIAARTPADTGTFRAWDGQTIQW